MFEMDKSKEERDLSLGSVFIWIVVPLLIVVAFLAYDPTDTTTMPLSLYCLCIPDFLGNDCHHTSSLFQIESQ